MNFKDLELREGCLGPYSEVFGPIRPIFKNENTSPLEKLRVQVQFQKDHPHFSNKTFAEKTNLDTA